MKCIIYTIEEMSKTTKIQPTDNVIRALGKEAYTKEMEQQVSESPDRTIFCYRNNNRWFAKNTVSLSPKAWVFEDYMIKEIIIE